MDVGQCSTHNAANLQALHSWTQHASCVCVSHWVTRTCVDLRVSRARRALAFLSVSLSSSRFGASYDLQSDRLEHVATTAARSHWLIPHCFWWVMGVHRTLNATLLLTLHKIVNQALWWKTKSNDSTDKQNPPEGKYHKTNQLQTSPQFTSQINNWNFENFPPPFLWTNSRIQTCSRNSPQHDVLRTVMLRELANVSDRQESN